MAVEKAVTQLMPSAPAQLASPAPMTIPEGDHRICSKQCHRRLQPPSAFRCSSELYGPLETFKHCIECIRKYRRDRMDLTGFRDTYINPDPRRHAQWLAEKARQQAEARGASDSFFAVQSRLPLVFAF